LSLPEIKDKIIEIIPHVKSAIAFESLENLVRGGRLSKTAGVLGNILGIRLILQIKDGELSLMDKVRGSKKAVKTIVDYMSERGIKKGEPCLILQIENREILEALKENLISNSISFIECEVGCVVGTHSGTGACGIFFIEQY
jgi:DegV family protein with EDD domain